MLYDVYDPIGILRQPTCGWFDLYDDLQPLQCTDLHLTASMHASVCDINVCPTLPGAIVAVAWDEWREMVPIHCVHTTDAAGTVVVMTTT